MSTVPPTLEDLTQKELHVIPIGDLRHHCAQPTCWCWPRMTRKAFAAAIWTHNAKDCREARERLTGQASSPGWMIVGMELNAAQAQPRARRRPLKALLAFLAAPWRVFPPAV